MDPLTFAGISGGTTVLGSLLTNQLNRGMVTQQEDFQRDMSGTAYQRAVADMQKAGLNPALMYGSGGAASTPQGAISAMQDPTAGISKGIETAQALRTQNQQINQQDSQIDNLDADTSNKEAQSALIKNQTTATAKEIEAKQISNKYLETSLQAQLKKAQAEGDYAQINQIMGVINSGASSASQLVNPLKLLPKSKTPNPTDSYMKEFMKGLK